MTSTGRRTQSADTKISYFRYATTLSATKSDESHSPSLCARRPARVCACELLYPQGSRSQPRAQPSQLGRRPPISGGMAMALNRALPLVSRRTVTQDYCADLPEQGRLAKLDLKTQTSEAGKANLFVSGWLTIDIRSKIVDKLLLLFCLPTGAATRGHGYCG